MPNRDVPVYSPLMVRDMPVTERPRERLRQEGAGKLSNAELIAILLRTGVQGESVLNLAQRLLSKFHGLAGLARASFGELCEEKGLSEAKACQVLAAIELGQRVAKLAPEQGDAVRSPQDVARLLLGEMSFLDQEHLRVVLLNTRNQVLRVHEVYVGNVNTSVVRIAEVLRPAIRENCPALIVVHNHPSGDPTPSEEDVLITRQIVEAGKLMDIEVLDHIIIGGQRLKSLRDLGLGFAEKAK